MVASAGPVGISKFSMEDERGPQRPFTIILGPHGAHESPHGALGRPYVARRPASSCGTHTVNTHGSRTTVYGPSTAVSESCASSTFSYGLNGAHISLKVFETSRRSARNSVRLPTGYLVFGAYMARNMPGSFM